MTRRSTHIDVAVGARVRAQRIAVGLERESFAASLGFDLRRLDRYEEGRERIDAFTLQEMAWLLEVCPASFLKGAAGAHAAVAHAQTPPAQTTSVEEAAGLLRAFLAIADPGARSRIAELVGKIGACPPITSGAPPSDPPGASGQPREPA